MTTTLEVLFAPAEFALLPQRDLSQSVCVVFDVLRATSTMLTGLANGARAILPVAEIDEALKTKQREPRVLLAGEREGFRIRADQTGGTEFDLGNSPREFTPDKVEGRTIVMTTTNGTRALKSCATAQTVLIGSFLGLNAVGHWIEREKPTDLLVVCSGTVDQTAYEDVLAAGALCDLIWPAYAAGKVSDSAVMARQLYAAARTDLLAAMQAARNGRRLLGHPELRDDVSFCLKQDVYDFVALLDKDGFVRKLG